MKKYKLLLLDLDGTLVNSKQDIANSTNYALTSLGYPSLDPEIIYSFVGSGATQLLENSVREASGISQDDFTLSKIIPLFRTHYFEHCLDETNFYPKVLDTLKILKQHNYILSVLTNKPKVFTDKILKGLNITHLFEGVVSGDEIYSKKPDPRGAHYLMERNNIKPSETLLVGDSLIDIETAQNAKIDIVFVTYGFGKSEEVQHVEKNHTIHDFSTLLTILGLDKG